jgi:hypothetical protein
MKRRQETMAGDATAINYNLWPWVGRASEPLQNQGFPQPVPGGVFGQGHCESWALRQGSLTHDQQTLPLQLAAMPDYVARPRSLRQELFMHRSDLQPFAVS